MDIVHTQHFTRSFKEAILGIRNDHELTYAVTIDALFTACENNCSFINELFVHHEQELSVDKLYGVLTALKEYQATKPLPDYLLIRIFKLIESRILNGQIEDINWINEAFSIIKKEYSFKRLKDFIDLANTPPFDIPETYFTIYIDLLKTYIISAKGKGELSEAFIKDESEKLRQKYDNNSDKKKYIDFLNEICSILNKSIIEPASMTSLSSDTVMINNHLVKIKKSFDKKADWGIRGLFVLWICFVVLLLSLAIYYSEKWFILGTIISAIPIFMMIISWIYFLFTKKTVKPLDCYAKIEKENRKRLYKQYGFDLYL